MNFENNESQLMEKFLGLKDQLVELDPQKQLAIQIAADEGMENFRLMYATLCKVKKYNKLEYYKVLEKLEADKTIENLFEIILQDARLGTKQCLDEIDEDLREQYVDKKITLNYSRTSLMASRPMQMFTDLYWLCEGISEPENRYMIKHHVFNWKRHNSLSFFYRQNRKKAWKYVRRRRRFRRWKRILKLFMRVKDEDQALAITLSILTAAMAWLTGID